MGYHVPRAKSWEIWWWFSDGRRQYWWSYFHIQSVFILQWLLTSLPNFTLLTHPTDSIMSYTKMKQAPVPPPQRLGGRALQPRGKGSFTEKMRHIVQLWFRRCKRTIENSFTWIWCPSRYVHAIPSSPAHSSQFILAQKKIDEPRQHKLDVELKLLFSKGNCWITEHTSNVQKNRYSIRLPSLRLAQWKPRRSRVILI